MTPGHDQGSTHLEESLAHLERWCEEQRIARSSVARVIEGVRISGRPGGGEQSPGQRASVAIPGLSAAPWWDSERFAWIPRLEATAQAVTEEYIAAAGGPSVLARSEQTALAVSGRWKTLYLYCIGKACTKNIDACPRTIAALDAIPEATGASGGMCYFSIMDPGTHVAAHTGYTNAHLRCHLALVAPDGARLRVHDETRAWTPGEVLVFDDSYEHEAWNASDSERVVLLFDIWHPDLNDDEVRALTFLMGLWRRLVARRFWSSEILSR
ncbi:aspartyl/asparaginyl beta-hydroxylase domain-containing protein [Actinomadura oligospora]|uniref:aspartyl/asparaginyl beta-hydroxylase domain-containing protein n=1 Tax=Actinomadura oligospora TaxID=111804 RepID=UPI00047BB08E|nr:aspartyl/asparaginyl beta-hydroxylase domain-containing protein [Actinomadura oligospora]